MASKKKVDAFAGVAIASGLCSQHPCTSKRETCYDMDASTYQSKIIFFSKKQETLSELSKLTELHYMFGGTPVEERCLMFSRVGNVPLHIGSRVTYRVPTIGNFMLHIGSRPLVTSCCI